MLPVGKTMTIWEILAAYRISMRNIEIVSSTYIDGGVCCLSGRTAAYRTQILRDPDFQWQFTHEFWMKKYHQHSGDDKFLTRWLVNHEWKTHIQACPEVELESTFKDNWRFLKQLLRWTRNTWRFCLFYTRSDIRSLIFERTIWRRYPYVAFTMLDKFFNPLTLLAGPVTVIYLTTRSAYLPAWVVVLSYLVWLILTRLIKYLPHFVKRPQDVLALPVWIIFNIYFALMKVYCLFTLHVTDWGTRAGADDKKEEELDTDIFLVQAEVVDRSARSNTIKGSSRVAKKDQIPALPGQAKKSLFSRNTAVADLEKGKEIVSPLVAKTRDWTREAKILQPMSEVPQMARNPVIPATTSSNVQQPMSEVSKTFPTPKIPPGSLPTNSMPNLGMPSLRGTGKTLPKPPSNADVDMSNLTGFESTGSSSRK